MNKCCCGVPKTTCLVHGMFTKEDGSMRELSSACVCGDPAAFCKVHNTRMSEDGKTWFFVPTDARGQSISVPTAPKRPMHQSVKSQPAPKPTTWEIGKVAPAFELFVFEDHDGEVFVRASMGLEVSRPVKLTTEETLVLIKIMGEVFGRAEKWSERSRVQVLPDE